MHPELTSGLAGGPLGPPSPSTGLDAGSGAPSDQAGFSGTSDAGALRPAASASIVVFTTVNGTLRQGRSGSYEDARVALELLAARGIPVVLMSHDDAALVRELQRELGLRQPFICDGGAVLHIPRGYFAELDGLTAGDESWEMFEFGVRDPARAIRLLASLFSVRGEEILTLGFGSEWEDGALLGAVDVPVVVRSDGADQSRLLRRIPGAYLTAAAGAAGWSEAILGPGGA
jgi:predicted mannosyl-3-phosphoglycerate phosphatase (HAD superfamily)